MLSVQVRPPALLDQPKKKTALMAVFLLACFLLACFFVGLCIEQHLQGLFEPLVQVLICSACVCNTGGSEVVGFEWALHSFGGIFGFKSGDAVAVEFGDLVAEDKVVDSG